jgi:beta-N-acetylhexosaminidase
MAGRDLAIPGAATDRSLGRLAEAILVPPFPGVIAPGWLLAAIDRGLAGVTLFGPNVSDPAQLAALTSQLRNAADEPVIAIEEEGGDVAEMAHRTGSPYPGKAALGAVDDTELTTEIYRALGSGQRRALDVNGSAGGGLPPASW